MCVLRLATKKLVCLEGRKVGMGEIGGYCIQDIYNDDLNQGVTVEVGRSGQIQDDLLYVILVGRNEVSILIPGFWLRFQVK